MKYKQERIKEKIQKKEEKSPYRFYEKYNFKIYKNVGNKKPIFYWNQIPPENYCKWKDSILEKYQNVTDINFFISFKAFLTNKLRNINQFKDFIPQLLSFVTLTITIIFATLTLLATLFQEDSIKQSIIHLFNIYLYIVFAIFFISAWYLLYIHKYNKRSNFFNDYIKVIDDMIIEKQNSSSTEDKA